MVSTATVAYLVALMLFISTGAPAFIALDQSHFPNPNRRLAWITSKWYFKAVWLISAFAGIGLMRPAAPGLETLQVSLNNSFGSIVSSLFVATWLVASLVAILVASTLVIAGVWHAMEYAPKLWQRVRQA